MARLRNAENSEETMESDGNTTHRQGHVGKEPGVVSAYARNAAGGRNLLFLFRCRCRYIDFVKGDRWQHIDNTF